MIGDFVVPPLDGGETRDFQTLHFDFGLPLDPKVDQDVARYTALYVPRSRIDSVLRGSIGASGVVRRVDAVSSDEMTAGSLGLEHQVRGERQPWRTRGGLRRFTAADA